MHTLCEEILDFSALITNQVRSVEVCEPTVFVYEVASKGTESAIYLCAVSA